MPSARPLDWALSPAIDFPSVSDSSRAKPRRSATNAAHRVSTGARLMGTEAMLVVGVIAAPSPHPHEPPLDALGRRDEPARVDAGRHARTHVVRAVPRRDVAAGGKRATHQPPHPPAL